MRGCRRGAGLIVASAVVMLTACDPMVGGGGPGDATEIPLGLTMVPLSLEPGDFDGDGNVDLLVGGTQSSIVRGAVFLGNGDGTFAAPIDAHLDASSAYPVVGRLDADDRDDVISLGAPGRLAAFVAQADGTLAPWSAWTTHVYGTVRTNSITDFEGDGDGDVVTLRRRTSVPVGEIEVDVTLGAGGDGIWDVATTATGNANTSGFDGNRMATADFDGDGLRDLVLTEAGDEVVRMLGAAPATFAFPLELGVALAPWTTMPGDLDGDGRDDLVVGSYADGAVQTFRNDGSGRFTGGPVVDLGGLAPYDADLGDFDDDGIADAVFVDDGDTELQWRRGDGAGGWATTATRTLASPAIRVHAVDVNGDGRDDVVAATFAAGSISVLLSQP